MVVPLDAEQDQLTALTDGSLHVPQPPISGITQTSDDHKLVDISAAKLQLSMEHAQLLVPCMCALYALHSCRH